MKYAKLSIIFFILAVTIVLNSATSNASQKTSGKDEYGNDWSYDAETKTLTFTGEGKAGADFIMDGHSPEPEWYDLHRETEKVVFSEKITEIGAGTCEGFTFTKKIELPQTLEIIGESAFSSCVRLESVNFPSSLRILGEYSFSGCYKLINIDLNEGLEVIGNAALASNKFESIIIPSTVKK